MMLLSEMLKSLFSWSLLIWLSNLILQTASIIYFFIISLMISKTWEELHWAEVCWSLLWTLALSSQIFLIHASCDFASSQVSITIFKCIQFSQIIIPIIYGALLIIAFNYFFSSPFAG